MFTKVLADMKLPKTCDPEHSGFALEEQRVRALRVYPSRVSGSGGSPNRVSMKMDHEILNQP